MQESSRAIKSLDVSCSGQEVPHPGAGVRLPRLPLLAHSQTHPLPPLPFTFSFYEWLTKGKGPTGKAPYYTRNPTPSELAGEKASDYDPADVPPLMFAGLWDSVTYEGASAFRFL